MFTVGAGRKNILFSLIHHGILGVSVQCAAGIRSQFVFQIFVMGFFHFGEVFKQTGRSAVLETGGGVAEKLGAVFFHLHGVF